MSTKQVQPVTQSPAATQPAAPGAVIGSSLVAIDTTTNQILSDLHALRDDVHKELALMRSSLLMITTQLGSIETRFDALATTTVAKPKKASTATGTKVNKRTFFLNAYKTTGFFDEFAQHAEFIAQAEHEPGLKENSGISEARKKSICYRIIAGSDALSAILNKKINAANTGEALAVEEPVSGDEN